MKNREGLSIDIKSDTIEIVISLYHKNMTEKAPNTPEVPDVPATAAQLEQLIKSRNRPTEAAKDVPKTDEKLSRKQRRLMEQAGERASNSPVQANGSSAVAKEEPPKVITRHDVRSKVEGATDYASAKRVVEELTGAEVIVAGKKRGMPESWLKLAQEKLGTFTPPPIVESKPVVQKQPEKIEAKKPVVPVQKKIENKRPIVDPNNEPVTRDQLNQRLSEINTKADLKETLDTIRRVGVLTEDGKLKKFKINGPEETAFFNDIRREYKKKFKKVRNATEGEQATEEEVMEKYKPSRRNDFEDTARDEAGIKPTRMKVQQNNAPSAKTQPAVIEKADETAKKIKPELVEKVEEPAAIEEAPKQEVKKPKAKKKTVAKEPKEKKGPEIENLFSGPLPTSLDFQSVSQALNEAGFVEFLKHFDKHNKTNSVEDIENGNESAIGERYETFTKARLVSIRMQEIWKKDLEKDFGDEILLPEDAVSSMDVYFSRLCVENPNEVERQAKLIAEFNTLPAEIDVEEKNLQAEIDAMSIKDQNGNVVADGREVLRNREEANEKKREMADELDKKFFDRGTYTVGSHVTKEKKGVKYFEKAAAAAKLIEEGVITGRIGYDKNHPLAHLFSPGKKIQRGIETLLNEVANEKHTIDHAKDKMANIEFVRDNLHKKFANIKGIILSEFGPSDVIRKAVNKAIKERIKSQMSDDKGGFERLEKAQVFYEKVRNASTNTDMNAGAEYFDEEDREEMQAKLDENIRKEFGGKIDEIIGNSKLGNNAYDALENSLIAWVNRPTADNRKFGSKEGVEAKKFVLDIFEERKNKLKHSDPKRFLLAHFIKRINKNEVVAIANATK